MSTSSPRIWAGQRTTAVIRDMHARDVQDSAQREKAMQDFIRSAVADEWPRLAVQVAAGLTHPG